MAMAVKALHLVRNNFVSDSRILKETRSLVESGVVNELEVVALGDGYLPEREALGPGRSVWRVPLATRARLPKDLASQSAKYAEWAARIIRRHGGVQWDIIHCHDLSPLPIAAALQKRTGARLIYDAHELETEMMDLRGVRQRLSRWTERRLMPRVDAMITVSPSIVQWYAQKYPGLDVTLVRNIPNRPPATAAPYPWRQELGVPDDARLFIYVGNLARGRGIPFLLQVFQRPECRHHLLFMGSGALSRDIEAARAACPRIHLHPPVPLADVVPRVAGADIGLSLLEDACLSYRYALPNKLFECLQGGVPVMVNDLPDQAAIVRDTGAGWVGTHSADEFAAVVDSIDAEDFQRKREAARRAALALDWRYEAQRLIDLYRRVLAPGWQRSR